MVGADSYRISRALQYSGVQTYVICVFAYKAITFFGYPFQSNSTNTTTIVRNLHVSLSVSHNTYITTHASLHDISLGYSHFAHHYSGNHIRFIFLALLRCFSSRGSPSRSIYSNGSFFSLSRRVSSFGDLRIKAY